MKESNIIYIALLDDHKMFLDGMKSMLQAIENFKIVFVENTAKKALLQLKFQNQLLLMLNSMKTHGKMQPLLKTS
jgi:DNA-binding NarL/FixJ family response regulator